MTPLEGGFMRGNKIPLSIMVVVMSSERFLERRLNLWVLISSHARTLGVSPFISNLVGLDGGLLRKPVGFPYRCSPCQMSPCTPLQLLSSLHLLLHQSVPFPLCSSKNWSLQRQVGQGHWLVDPTEKKQIGFSPKFTFRRLLGSEGYPPSSPPPPQLKFIC